MTQDIVFKINDIPGFNDLISNYSNDTLKLNKIIYITRNNETYTIIRYNKYLLTEDLISSVGLLRCLVLNDEQRALSFSPPKSIYRKQFFNLYPGKTNDIIAEEFVDGTMINVFWNYKMNLAGGWEISTRNTVGAEIFCAKTNPKKTYADLFKETLKEVNLDLQLLNRAYNYSFIMQHPSILGHPLCKKAALYLIEVYEIVQTENGSIYIYPLKRDKIKNQINCWNITSIKFPQEYYDWENYNELQNKYASVNTSYTQKGVVLRNNKTGERSKIWNPTYQYAKQINEERGKELFQYLYLRYYGKISDILKNNPINKRNYNIFRNHVHDFTNTLHQNYIECYICKTRKINEINEIFRPHLIYLQEMYINELRIKKEYISKSIIIKYVNKLEPKRLFHCLNKPTRNKACTR